MNQFFSEINAIDPISFGSDTQNSAKVHEKKVDKIIKKNFHPRVLDNDVFRNIVSTNSQLVWGDIGYSWKDLHSNAVDKIKIVDLCNLIIGMNYLVYQNTNQYYL